MRDWFRDRENKKLLGIVAGLWILGAIFYFAAGANPAVELHRHANTVVSDLQKIPNESRDKHAQLSQLIFNALIDTHRETFARELTRHAALALFIAGLLILAVDIHTRRSARIEAARDREETRKDIAAYTRGVAENVWKAVSGRSVPDEICKEIDGILKCDVVKENCQYVITIGLPYENVPDGLIVIRREVSYFARNLTGMQTVYPLRSRIENVLPDVRVKRDGIEMTLPKHIKCAVADENIPSEKYLSPDNPRLLSCDITLEKDSGKHIYLVWDELCKTTDVNVYTTLTPMKDLTVRVIKMSEKVVIKEVLLHHPRPTDFLMTQDNLWEFKGGVLPGQAFSISWEWQAAQAQPS
jgi:hypothetical protein